MNDIDEFKFKIDYEPSLHTARLLTKAVAQYRTTNYLPPDISVSRVLKNGKLKEIAAPIIENLVQECRAAIGIISFSLTKNDDRLWEEYGGKGNGVVVEINIPDHLVGQSFYPVRYVPDKIFHVDSFLEAALFPDRAFETYRNILLTKTKRWEGEQEIRFIGNRQDVNIIFDGYISEVTFGSNVTPHILETLVAHIASYSNANNIRITKLSSK